MYANPKENGRIILVVSKKEFILSLIGEVITPLQQW